MSVSASVSSNVNVSVSVSVNSNMMVSVNVSVSVKLCDLGASRERVIRVIGLGFDRKANTPFRIYTRIRVWW